MDLATLKNSLKYDPLTGHFTWLEDRGAKKFKGMRAGANGSARKDKRTRYRDIQFQKVSYKEHRLAWFYMTGRWPEQIDHIDGNGLNNKWENLREVSLSENLKNKPLYKNNKSGVLGVRWDRKKLRWRAVIAFNGKRLSLGHFEDFFEACCARKSAKNKHGFHSNHGRTESAA